MAPLDYLPFLLIWALPVVLIEWLFGGRYLVRRPGTWLLVIAGLGIYFSLADAVAISSGIWQFDASRLVGIWLGPVPLEEVLFYFLTSAMVVQGFVAFWGAMEERRWMPGWLAALMRRNRAAAQGKTARRTDDTSTYPVIRDGAPGTK